MSARRKAEMLLEMEICRRLGREPMDEAERTLVRRAVLQRVPWLSREFGMEVAADRSDPPTLQ